MVAVGKGGSLLEEADGQKSMRKLRTVLLYHDAVDSSHFDWLLDTPSTWGLPRSKLWTARTQTSAGDWANAGTWDLSRIADHRRRYLTYQGVLDDARGRVDRVDEGWFVPQLWDCSQIILDLTLTQCQGRVRLCRLDGTQWCGTWLGSTMFNVAHNNY